MFPFDDVMMEIIYWRPTVESTLQWHYMNVNKSQFANLSIVWFKDNSTETTNTPWLLPSFVEITTGQWFPTQRGQ